jgi:hypothetical protein
LNRKSLEQALNEIVARHEILRTCFKMEADQTIQVILPRRKLAIEMIDLRHTSVENRRESINQHIDEELYRPFELSTGPLIRVRLTQLAQDDHLSILNLHHVVTDGWSMAIMRRELNTLYDAFSYGQPSPLPALSIQYADYTLWQREWLTGAPLQRQMDYWKRQLAGAPALLELPWDKPRKAVQLSDGASKRLMIPPEVVRVLKEISRRQEVTLFMTLLTAFYILLYRYSNQTDLLVGTPIANRNRAEIGNLIGFFVNTLVLRCDMSGNPTFTDLLMRVRQMTLDAYQHQDTPFEQLVEILQPERSQSFSPLFQVVFALQNAPSDDLHLKGLALTAVEVGSRLAKFDLSLMMWEDNGALAAQYTYPKDLFNADTISRMARHLKTLLLEIGKHPDRSINQLPLINAVERNRLLVEWNDTASDYLQAFSIPRMVGHWTRQAPRSVAVVDGNVRLSYRELNGLANTRCHVLDHYGRPTPAGIKGDLSVHTFREKHSDFLSHPPAMKRWAALLKKELAGISVQQEANQDKLGEPA